VNTAHNAGKLALSENYSEIKSFAEKIGTNRQLMDKKMLFEFAPPFSFIAIYKGLQTTSTANAVLEEKGDMKLSPSWYPERDLNPHALRHTPLKRTCIPIPTSGHYSSWDNSLSF